MRRNKIINQNCKNQKMHKFNNNQNYNKTMNWEKTEISKNKIISIKIKNKRNLKYKNNRQSWKYNSNSI